MPSLARSLGGTDRQHEVANARDEGDVLRHVVAMRSRVDADAIAHDVLDDVEVGAAVESHAGLVQPRLAPRGQSQFRDVGASAIERDTDRSVRARIEVEADLARPLRACRPDARLARAVS